MTTIAFPPWEPDKAHLNPNSSANIKNVVPNADGYGPFPALVPYSSALGGPCLGAILARSGTGTYAFFAGTTAKLYRLSGNTWDDASNGVYTVPSGHNWSFVQFGEAVIASNMADFVQQFTLGSSTDFANLAGSPPSMRWIWSESGYLGGGQVTGSERKIYRSGLNDATYWEYGQRGSTYQSFPDGGEIQGAVTSETGALIMQQQKVRQLVNRPGEDIGFSINTVEDETGPIAPNSIVSVGQRVFYLAEEGFHMLGQPSVHIGAERIDRTFLDDIDLNRIDEVQGVADPFRKIAWWRYSSNSNTGNPTFSDKLIGFAWELNRWAYAEMNLEWLTPLALPGYTLEELSSVLGYTNLDLIPFSLDSRVFKGGRPTFAAFDSSHKLGTFEGAALEAVLDTADIPLGGEGQRHFVSGFRPVGDVSGSYGRVIAKSTFGDTNTTPSTENVQGLATGLIPCRINARTSRFRLRIPAGSEWSHIQGVEIPKENARAAGRR